MLGARSKGEPLLCCPPPSYVTLLPSGCWGRAWYRGSRLQRDHCRAGCCHTPPSTAHRSRTSCAQPRGQSLGLQLPQGRTPSPDWVPSQPSAPRLQHRQWGEAGLSLPLRVLYEIPHPCWLTSFAGEERSCSSQHRHTTGLLTPADPCPGSDPRVCTSCSSACSTHHALLGTLLNGLSWGSPQWEQGWRWSHPPGSTVLGGKQIRAAAEGERLQGVVGPPELCPQSQAGTTAGPALLQWVPREQRCRGSAPWQKEGNLF